MLDKEALVVLTNLSQIVAKKPEETISHIHGRANVQIEIVVVKL